jgi:hypothetical protein
VVVGAAGGLVDEVGVGSGGVARLVVDGLQAANPTVAAAPVRNLRREMAMSDGLPPGLHRPAAIGGGNGGLGIRHGTFVRRPRLD